MITCRLATEADLPAVYLINRESNPHTWAEQHFQAALLNQNLYLAEYQNQITAFAVWQRVLDEAELHLIVCDRSFQKMGMASALIQDFVVQHQEIKRLFLEVRESNQAARNLYQKQGFYITGRRKNYYMFPIEDALIMEKSC